ncbi:hypothetical protein OH768_27435 [Streptomyces sp. NBC_01622]|uniref:hypothetical protein n=1 Tax=Streptomyces sp. NBC_01622 TaxID=2975903 RepID=UPI00386B97DB|nr:hypothetical protein OH768_27435 [Streptomyces sp. NBC_01622]
MDAHAAVAAGSALGRRARVAWLLRVNRLPAEESSLRSLPACSPDDWDQLVDGP